MFNSSNIDEVSVKATHMEDSKGKLGVEGVSKKPPKFKKHSKRKKEKDKKEATEKKDTKESTCSHYQKKGHDETQWWKLHPELLPNKFKGKGKQNIVETIQQDLISESRDESKIVAMGVKGILSTNSNSSIQSTKLESDIKEKKMNDMFHIRVIMNHTKIYTLFYNGVSSQSYFIRIF